MSPLGSQGRGQHRSQSGPGRSHGAGEAAPGCASRAADGAGRVARRGFAYLLDGEAAFGTNRRRAKPPQLVLLGPGDELSVTDAVPSTRYLLMAGQPYGEVPVFNGPYVD